MNHTRVIGIGNLHAGDDAVGIHVIRQLRSLCIPGVDLIEAGMAGLTLLDFFEGAHQVIVVDAVRSTQDVGSILWLDMPRDQEQLTHLSWDSINSSTHTMGLSDTIALGATLGVLPQHLSIVGIELGHIKQGAPLSFQVNQALERVVSTIMKHVNVWTCTNFT